MDDGKVIVALIAAMASLFGAVLSLSGVRFGGKISKGNADKSIFIQVVTSERKIWRDSLRTHVSEMNGVAMAAAFSPREVPDWATFYRAASQIILRLNPTCRGEGFIEDKHAPDRAVFVSVCHLISCRTSQDAPWFSACKDLEEAVQNLLKKEWEVSKKEAEVGRLITASEIDAIVEKLAATNQITQVGR
jgi:hypothetical protein